VNLEETGMSYSLEVEMIATAAKLGLLTAPYVFDPQQAAALAHAEADALVAAYVLGRTEGVVGFFGASSMERLPTEVAMTENMRRVKALAERS
jgi:predicted TIM-barrel enzyme